MSTATSSVAQRHIAQGALSNGITWSVWTEPSDTMCSVQVWLRAGSSDELPGETGSAHMLEHMMFRGSTGVPDGEFDARMESLGAIVNASTWLDSTSYTTLCTPEVLGEVVALEAERHRGVALKAKVLAAERDVVANERRQVVDASAESKLRERFMFAAQRGTPYAWPVIGWAEDIQAYTAGTLRRFFDRCYAPSRTHVVFCGPIDPNTAERLAEECFVRSEPRGGWSPADLFRGKESEGVVPPIEVPNPERFVEFPVDVSTPIIHVGFEAPCRLDSDWPAWRVATSVLCGGESARLPQQLEFERALVLSIDLDMYDTRMPLAATLEASTRRGCTVDEVLIALDDVLWELAENGPTEHELARWQRSLRTDEARALANPESRAEWMGESWVLSGDPTRLFSTAEELQNVTAEDVKGVARAMLAPSKRTVVVGVPLG